MDRGRPLVAVIDIGKSNVKVSVADAAGRILEARSAPNRVRPARPPAAPWAHHDLAALRGWIGAELARACRDWPVGHVVPTGHGSGCVLVAADPDAGGDGAALPMIDYEDPCPPEVTARWVREAGGFLDRGSQVMMASTHQGRQMLRAETEAPEAFARAAASLAVAPYWAWVLSGVAASEVTALGAQSGLWNVATAGWAPVVARRGWGRLLPPVRPAWEVLGPLRPAFARAFGIPEGLRVHLGGHDSSLNFYRYQAAGLSGFTLVSTGTWIVALSDGCPPGRLAEARGMTLNADVAGRPVGGALNMGGREFLAIAGEVGEGAPAAPGALARILAKGTVAVPSFGADDGQFPGSAGRGRIEGPPPADAGEARALGLLHAVMLTLECLRLLGGRGRVVLDGAFLKEPHYAPLVAALLPGREILASREAAGVSSGAALLAGHAARAAGGAGPVAANLDPVRPAALAGLAEWAALWRSRAGAPAGGAATAEDA